MGSNKIGDELFIYRDCDHTFWKANLSDPKRMKKLIQAHLPKEVVAQMDLSTLAQKPTEFIQKRVLSRFLRKCGIRLEALPFMFSRA